MIFRNITYIMNVVATILGLLLLHSCNKDNPAYNRENVKGTWIVTQYDGTPLDMRDYTVMTFDKDFNVTYWGIQSKGTGDYQWGNNLLGYDIYCCDLAIFGTYSGIYGYLSPVSTHQEYLFSSVEDSLMTISNAVYQINDAYITPPFSDMTMKKIHSKYASTDSLAGVWQFLTKDGQEYNNHRIQFHADGKLVIYHQDNPGQWVPMGDKDYFNKYEDFLPLTIWSNEEFGEVNHWSVNCFRIENCMPKSGTMTLFDQYSEYKLSFISAN